MTWPQGLCPGVGLEVKSFKKCFSTFSVMETTWADSWSDMAKHCDMDLWVMKWRSALPIFHGSVILPYIFKRTANSNQTARVTNEYFLHARILPRVWCAGFRWRKLCFIISELPVNERVIIYFILVGFFFPRYLFISTGCSCSYSLIQTTELPFSL